MSKTAHDALVMALKDTLERFEKAAISCGHSPEYVRIATANARRVLALAESSENADSEPSSSGPRDEEG